MPYADPEKRREMTRRWKANNRDKLIAYRLADTEGNRARQKKFISIRLSEDPNWARNKQAAWVKENRAHRRTYHRRWKGWPEPTRPEPDHCECCGASGGHKGLHLDHCHQKNVFRGWLCSKCNLGLGLLGDSLESVAKAVDYLKRSIE